MCCYGCKSLTKLLNLDCGLCKMQQFGCLAVMIIMRCLQYFGHIRLHENVAIQTVFDIVVA